MIDAHPNEYKIGEDLRLRCYTDPPLNDVIITWYKEGVPMSYAASDRVVSLEDGKLEVIRVQPEDSGVYECEVRRIDGGDDDDGGARLVRATSIEVQQPQPGESVNNIGENVKIKIRYNSQRLRF